MDKNLHSDAETQERTMKKKENVGNESETVASAPPPNVKSLPKEIKKQSVNKAQNKQPVDAAKQTETGPKESESASKKEAAVTSEEKEKSKKVRRTKDNQESVDSAKEGNTVKKPKEQVEKLPEENSTRKQKVASKQAETTVEKEEKSKPNSIPKTSQVSKSGGANESSTPVANIKPKAAVSAVKPKKDDKLMDKIKKFVGGKS